LSIVPYRGGRTRARREPLTRERIVQVAVGLLDAVGLDGLTMRALAAALQVKAASLYRHVRDKQELLVLLADELSTEVPIYEPTGSWEEDARAMAAAAREGLLAHRDAARVMAESPPMGPRRLRHVDAALQVFLNAGFTKADAAAAAYHFNNLVTELAADEARMRQAAADQGTTGNVAMESMRNAFRDLPADELPALNALADELASGDFDALFAFGLDVMLAGLRQRLAETRASPTTLG